MNYMQWIERSAENLKFFLWLRDYTERFDQLPASEKALAPEWSLAQNEAALAAVPTNARGSKKANAAADIFNGTDFDDSKKREHAVDADPFGTPPRTPEDAAERRDSSQPWSQSGSSYGTSALQSSTAQSRRIQAGEAFESVGLKQPCKLRHFTGSYHVLTCSSHHPAIPRGD